MIGDAIPILIALQHRVQISNLDQTFNESIVPRAEFHRLDTTPFKCNLQAQVMPSFDGCNLSWKLLLHIKPLYSYAHNKTGGQRVDNPRVEI